MYIYSSYPASKYSPAITLPVCLNLNTEAKMIQARGITYEDIIRAIPFRCQVSSIAYESKLPNKSLLFTLFRNFLAYVMRTVHSEDN